MIHISYKEQTTPIEKIEIGDEFICKQVASGAKRIALYTREVPGITVHMELDEARELYDALGNLINEIELS